MKRKVIIMILIIFSSCSNSEDQEVCECRELRYERRNTFNQQMYEDRLINQRDIDGCYTLEEAKVKQWYTSDNYTIIQCDDYL